MDSIGGPEIVTQGKHRPVVGRLAPTPSGWLHLGNARSFLLAWLWARRSGGKIVMRVEDLDRPRCRRELREAALGDLEWLGLDWDEGPHAGDSIGAFDQSTRFGVYRDALEQLIADRRVYPCTCSRKDVELATSAPHGDEGPIYPSTCRDRWVSAEEARAAAGREPTWRFRFDGPAIEFRDEIQGDVRIDPAALGDFVVWRRDEVPGYQLAVAVDDAAHGVTQVLRGADLLASTARQIAVYSALGLDAPEEWAHVPFVRDEAGGRMAKRDASLALGTLREEGVDPRRLVGFLAWTAGLLERPEAVSAHGLVGTFDVAKVGTQEFVWTEAHRRSLRRE